MSRSPFWQERSSVYLGACASQLSFWGHDFSDGAWPDAEDLGILLGRTVRELAQVTSMRGCGDLLAQALRSLEAAHRWSSRPCPGAPSMEALHLREAAGLMGSVRRHLAESAPRSGPCLPPQRSRARTGGTPAG
ncbi:hypothetical protein ACFYUY_12875 [Kitasatospora sp. NPDC004745]|uniref:hypothetical protein n=1 Tax=unclassified Kitasatospora TaxID=2633591 RepID=UPI0033F3487A